MTRQQERRKHRRIRVRDKFLIRFRDVDRLRRVFVRDISKGGMFVRTQNPRPEGSQVQIVLELPNGEKVPLSGEVVYAVEATEPGREAGNGVQFTDLTPASKAMLEDYIEDHMPEEQAEVIDIGGDEPAPTPAAPAREIAGAVKVAIEADDTNRVSLADLEVLLHLADQVVELEKLQWSHPYELLGVEEHASEHEIREAHADRVRELELGSYPGVVPALLKERIGRALSKLQRALETLTDVPTRAALDFELGVVVPRRSEVRSAFKEELLRRRGRASEDHVRELDKGRSFAVLGAKEQNAGNLEKALTLYRAALLFDPFDIDIRQRLATVEAKLTLRKR